MSTRKSFSEVKGKINVTSDSVGWQPHCHLWPSCLEDVRTSTSQSRMDLFGLLHLLHLPSMYHVILKLSSVRIVDLHERYGHCTYRDMNRRSMVHSCSTVLCTWDDTPWCSCDTGSRLVPCCSLRLDTNSHVPQPWGVSPCPMCMSSACPRPPTPTAPWELPCRSPESWRGCRLSAANGEPPVMLILSVWSISLYNIYSKWAASWKKGLIHSKRRSLWRVLLLSCWRNNTDDSDVVQRVPEISIRRWIWGVSWRQIWIMISSGIWHNAGLVRTVLSAS